MALSDPQNITATTITCQCGKKTYRATAIFGATGEPQGCWLALDVNNEPVPGCNPDDRFDELIARRNLPKSKPQRERFPGNAAVRCVCGRSTLVMLSDINLIDALPCAEPLDERVPYLATTCWLAIEGDARIAGCVPDERTDDILARWHGRRSAKVPRDTTAQSPIGSKTNHSPITSAIFRTNRTNDSKTQPAKSTGDLYHGLTSDESTVEAPRSKQTTSQTRQPQNELNHRERSTAKSPKPPDVALSLFG